MSGFSVPVYRAFFQGAVAAGGSINVYVTGTTTFVTCYADGGLVTPISNPITLDANGEAKFYVSGSTNLRIDSYTATGTFIETVDPVLPVAGASNTAAGSIVYQGTNLTLSTANLSNNIISTAPINIVLPLSTGFTNSFSVQLNAQGGAITLIPNAADSIQKQTVGTNFTLPQGSTGELWTDAAGNWGLNFGYVVGQIKGTATNDNASAGNVGEFIFSNILVGSAVSLSTGVPGNITTISLTAGDWDVWGNIVFVGASSTITSLLAAAISQTTGSLGTFPSGGALSQWIGSITGVALPILSGGKARMSVASLTTVYLVGQANFTTSTLTAYGFLGARRVR